MLLGMDLIIEFNGGDADRHLLRAFEGSESLEGFARALTLVTHYAVTGRVRKKYPFDDSLPIFIAATEPGSFRTVFRFILKPGNTQITSIGGAASLAVVTSIVASLVQTTFTNAIGQIHAPENPAVQRQIVRRPGDIDALTDAIEPSLKRGHTIINNGAGTINIYSGANRLGHFDARTKSYLNETLHDPTLRRKQVSVSMLNANTKYGRVFDYELGRTIPIKVVGHVPPGTIPTLATSLRRYSRRIARLSDVRGLVVITFTVETTLEGVPKRYLVQSAEVPDVEPQQR